MKEKRRTRCRLLPLLLYMFLFFAGGCDSNEDTETFETFDGYEALQLLDWNDKWDVYFKGEWVIYGEYKNQSGWIKKNLSGNLGIALSKDDEIVNFFPENISQNLLKEDMEIIFSGEVRAHTTANVYPLPLFIKNIQIKKQTVIK